MLKLDSNKMKTTKLEYEVLLYTYCRALFNVEYADLLLANTQALYDGCVHSLQRYVHDLSGKDFDSIDAEHAMKFLIDYEGVEPSEFIVRKRAPSGKPYETTSFDEDTREKLVNKDLALEFMEYYEDVAKLKYSLQNFKSLRGMMYKSDKIGHNGKPMYAVPFQYSPAVTGRTYTNKMSVQAIPKGFLKAIQAPKGWHILWCDFDQIDLNVALNICLINEDDIELKEFLLQVNDKYEAFARYMYFKSNQVFDVDEFKQHRPLYKQLILSCIYKASLQSLKFASKNDSFSQKLYDTVNDNAAYIVFRERLLSAIRIPENFNVYTYFGSVRHCIGGSHNNERSIFNTPIQGTSQDIMELFTQEVCGRMQPFSREGLVFFPYFNRHDEMLFLVRDDIVSELYRVIDCMNIQVDDWSPISLSWDIGNIYGVRDEETYARVIESVRNHPLTNVTKTPRVIPYSPTERSVEVYVDVYKFNNTQHIYAQILGEKYSDCSTCYCPDNLVDLNYFLWFYLELSLKLDLKKNYDRIIVYSNYDGYIEVQGIETYIIDHSENFLYMEFNAKGRGMVKEYMDRKGLSHYPEEFQLALYIKPDKEVKRFWLM